MSIYRVRPLEDRSGFKGNPKPSPFNTGSGWDRKPVPFGATRSLLERELGHLGARDVILEVDVLPGRIRNDGELYADAKVNSPAVRLHFDSNHGHLTYATDAFTKWQDNVRAIALALEALRKVDRYEVGQGGDQYRGYLALEAGAGGIALGGMTSDEAREVICANSSWAEYEDFTGWNDPRAAAKLLRSAQFNSHPDRNNGDQTQWDLVERAAKVLGL